MKPSAVDGVSPPAVTTSMQMLAAKLMQRSRDSHMLSAVMDRNPWVQKFHGTDEFATILEGSPELQRFYRSMMQLQAVLGAEDAAAAVEITNQPTDILKSAAAVKQQKKRVELQTSSGMSVVRRCMRISGISSARRAAKESSKMSFSSLLQQHSRMSDAEQLALLSPAPIDALVDQRVWCRTQQQLLHSHMMCDTCLQSVTDNVSSGKMLVDLDISAEQR